MKVLLWLMLTFTLLFCVLYFIISYEKKNQIDTALSEQLKHLDISYQQGLDRFSVIAHTAYTSIQNDAKLLEILDKASKKEDVDGKLYGELYDYYKAEYEKLTFLDVMYVQFILPNSTSFVRMHKAEKFGDDLRGVRYSVELVNKKKIM
jgi:Ca2+/Na+ antiporter